MPLPVYGNHFGLLIQNVKKEILAIASSTYENSVYDGSFERIQIYQDTVYERVV
jgi:hypothetical protein